MPNYGNSNVVNEFMYVGTGILYSKMYITAGTRTVKTALISVTTGTCVTLVTQVQNEGWVLRRTWVEYVSLHQLGDSLEKVHRCRK